MNLVHIIEKFFTSGASSSLKQIYDSLSKSDIIKSQSVICLKNDGANLNKKPPDYFPLDSKIYSYSNFCNEVKAKQFSDSVFVFHKLMCSPTRTISNILHKTDRPFLAINHTYVDNIIFNKMYNFNYCVSVSDHMSKKIIKVNKGIKSYVIKNIVDYEYVNRFDFKNYDKEEFFTGRINSLNAIKYNSDFIKWICSLDIGKKHVHEYIGSGQYMNEANSICNSYNNNKSQCRMLGSINEEEEKFKKIKSWDIFLYHINRPEGTSMSVLESLASGTPVVCCDLPGNNELIVQGVNGFVFSHFGQAEQILKDLSGNPEKLQSLKKSTLNWAKENLKKEKLKKQYEEAILDIVENFNSKNFKYKKVKNNLLKERTDKDKNIIYTGKKHNIKKAVQDRFAIKKKTEEKFPDRNFGKKIIGSSILQKSDTKDANPVLVIKTYFPILNFESVLNLNGIYSDFFLIFSEGQSHQDYGVDNSQLIDKDFVILNYENKTISNILDIDNLFVLKKTEILLVSKEKFNYIKNKIIDKKIWVEEEK